MSLQRAWSEGPWRTFIVTCSLAVLTALLYAPAVGFGYVNFDDHDYVKENARVLSGPTWSGFRWALATESAANWHPLTWVSLMLDARVGGDDPHGYHRTNVMLHAASSALLFLVFLALTGATWRSALVAALFALHPLHVESVAWIAERKDVLSGVFFMLTLLVYERFVRRRSWKWYAALVVVFGAGLMAKPMLVSIPLVLLILDFWPLGRFGAAPGPAGFRTAVRTGVLVEKIPLVAMSAASCAMTLHAQAAAGAVSGLERLSIGERAANAVVAYASYLGKTLWPTGLAALYPHPRGTLAAVDVLVSLAVLVSLSVLAYIFRARRPWLAAGCLWYGIMLVPVIGLVQVGSQAMADRYTYLPLIGIFAAVAWSLPVPGPRRAPALAAGVAIALVSLCLVTRAQLMHWRDGITLFEQAIRVTGPNARAHDGLGMALATQGRLDEALSHFEESLRIDPADGRARCDLAAALVKTGRTDEAQRNFEEGLRRAPGNARCRANFGTLLLKARDLGRAQAELEEAIQLAPDDVPALKNLGVTLAMQGRMADAVVRFQEALRISPNDEELRQNLERAKGKLGRVP